MLPESKLRLFQTLASWWKSYTKLDALLRRDTLPTPTELGELAWLRFFDRGDLSEFLSDLHDGLVAASADEDIAALEATLHAWRTTAHQLEDPLRRSVLLGEHTVDDYVEVGQPDAAE
jgi:hypothetical protein